MLRAYQVCFKINPFNPLIQIKQTIGFTKKIVHIAVSIDTQKTLPLFQNNEQFDMCLSTSMFLLREIHFLANV